MERLLPLPLCCCVSGEDHDLRYCLFRFADSAEATVAGKLEATVSRCHSAAGRPGTSAVLRLPLRTSHALRRVSLRATPERAC